MLAYHFLFKQEMLLTNQRETENAEPKANYKLLKY